MRHDQRCHYIWCLKTLDYDKNLVYEYKGKRFCNRACFEAYLAFLKAIREAREAKLS
jgi:hypothetical protein